MRLLHPTTFLHYNLCKSWHQRASRGLHYMFDKQTTESLGPWLTRCQRYITYTESSKTHLEPQTKYQHCSWYMQTNLKHQQCLTKCQHCTMNTVSWISRLKETTRCLRCMMHIVRQQRPREHLTIDRNCNYCMPRSLTKLTSTTKYQHYTAYILSPM
jgi:hypothetical protein